MKDKITAPATKFLLAVLRHVPFDGWTDKSLDRAQKSCGMTNAAVKKLFPSGVVDLIRYFSIWADAEMLKKLPKKKLSAMRVRDKITLGVRARLEILTLHREAVSAAMRYMALPPRNVILPKLVWKTSDVIWQAAGDTATDYNHYTKRLLLSGVLSATTLYWLSDDSEDNMATWKFLDRRIGNVLSLGKIIGKMKEKVS